MSGTHSLSLCVTLSYCQKCIAYQQIVIVKENVLSKVFFDNNAKNVI
jgi:hypothetical protein